MELIEYLGEDVSVEMEVAVLNIIKNAETVSNDLLDNGITDEQEIAKRFSSDPALLKALLEYHRERAAMQFCDDLDAGKTNL